MTTPTSSTADDIAKEFGGDRPSRVSVEWETVSFENLALSDGRRVSGRRQNGVVTIDGD